MEEREAVQLGSLLHDMGKLLQRTHSIKLTNADRALESTCCPTYKGRSSHIHSLFTMKFFAEVWPGQLELAELLATFHHRPETCTQSRLAKIVTLADRLASGERQSLDEEELGDPRTARLCCIFSSLRLEMTEEKMSYFPLLPLDSNIQRHFPSRDANLVGGESYDVIWQGLFQDLKRLDPSIDFQRFYTQIHHLLERYTLFVPSAAYRDRADISLFHHAKATAAISTCIYDLNLSEAGLDQLLKALVFSPGKDVLREQSMWLVGGDLSGIQDFIYGISSKGALKGLRGRSVYLQLLAEALAVRLLKEFSLTCSNLLYCGGGHFYLLVPNKPGSAEILQRCQDQVDRVLVKAHRGQLALNIGWKPLRFEDFFSTNLPLMDQDKNPARTQGGFAGVWDDLGLGLARKKRNKFEKIASNPDELHSLLGPFPIEGIESACDLCGETAIPIEGEVTRCEFCHSFEELASRVARSTYFRVDPLPRAKVTDRYSSYEDVLNAVGVGFRFLRSNQSDPTAYILNQTDIIGSKSVFQGFRFLARHTPLTTDGETITLEELAGRATGVSKWGVLRADVDHLGRVFRFGLEGSDRSISRVSMLSSLLSLYFSAHVEHIARQEQYKEKLAVVYAGGDDLFVIGSWSSLLGFAEEIYRDFRSFTANRITLSAGLFLAPGTGYPVAHAGRLAGEEEQAAKDDGRDRITFFGQPVQWDVLPEHKEIRENLLELIKGQAPRSLFSLLYQSYELQHRARQGEILLFPVWRLLYAIRRMVERHRSLAPLFMSLEKLLIKNLWLPDHGITAIRWVEYLTREGGRED
jgi:CRISPR-associated protein Csm1